MTPSRPPPLRANWPIALGNAQAANLSNAAAKAVVARTTVQRCFKVGANTPVGLASFMAAGALLVTRNTRDFPVDDPFVRIPYSV